MIQKYKLVADAYRNEWRLLKKDANYAESIFLTLEAAIQKLPDAVGNIAAIIKFHDVAGAICGQHFVRADRER